MNHLNFAILESRILGFKRTDPITLHTNEWLLNKAIHVCSVIVDVCGADSVERIYKIMSFERSDSVDTDSIYLSFVSSKDLTVILTISVESELFMSGNSYQNMFNANTDDELIGVCNVLKNFLP